MRILAACPDFRRGPGGVTLRERGLARTSAADDGVQEGEERTAAGLSSANHGTYR